MHTLHFLYHQIRLDKSDYTYAIDLKEFQQQAEFLTARLHATPPDSGAPFDTVVPAITFDDGHRSIYEYALPVLERLSVRTNQFITVGWAGERASYMTWPELLVMQGAGQQIGAHGWSHKLLTHCSPSELQREVRDSKRKLEDGLGAAVTSMSLPGGRYNRRVLAVCQEAGYDRVFTSEPRAEQSPPQSWLNGRVNLLSNSDVPLLQQLLQPASRQLAALGRQYHIKRSINAVLGDALYAKAWTLVNGGQNDSEETDPKTFDRPGSDPS